MQNQSTKLDKAVKISIVAGALVVALSVAYYFFIYLPKKETAVISYGQESSQIIKEEEKVEVNTEEKRSPSERALTAAAFAFYNGSDKDRENFQKIFDEGGKDANLTINNFASVLDMDISSLIEVETINDKIKRSKGESKTYTNPTPSSNSTSATSQSYYDEHKQRQQQQCQEDINKYTICMSKYNSEMAEYNSCLSEGKMSYCSKPFSFCYKPICAY
ncbi:MAG: hypothetical protein Q7U36_02710 [bacterium]|nr:hypothetical protein [bacterium]